MASLEQKRAAFPQPYVLDPKLEHKQTFILLHGLGCNGEDFGSAFLQTSIGDFGQCLPKIFPHARFIFPTAKFRRSTAFNRSLITQWFDIAKLSDSEYKKQTQIEGLVDSADFLYDIIKHEIATISAKNIILGGISHGCAMSASLLIALDYSLGAYIGLCGWLPFQMDLRDVMSVNLEPSEDFFGQYEDTDISMEAVNFERELLEVHHKLSDALSTSLATPIFVCHGGQDNKVIPQRGAELVATLKMMGYDAIWKTYSELGHEFNGEELGDIVKFLEKMALKSQ
jgi:predicted esterase